MFLFIYQDIPFNYFFCLVVKNVVLYKRLNNLAANHVLTESDHLDRVLHIIQVKLDKEYKS